MVNRPKRSTATRLITTAVPQVTDATTLIEMTDTAETPKPIVWPWLATIGALVLTAIIVLVAILSGGPAPTPSPSPTTPSASPTETETPTPTPTPTDPNQVVVLSSDIFGVNIDDAASYLESLELVVIRSEGLEVANDDPRLLTVYDASPLGQMATGTTVTLTFYIPFANIEPAPDETTQE
jgi:serine/threonine-protein kinase